MDKVVDGSFEDRAKGCFYGALIGDAVGAFLEFSKSVSDKEADQAMTMPGKGPFNLGRGQVTDDGELALCLGHGLVDGQGKLDLNKVAKWYHEWNNSNPFDCGLTIGTAVESIRNPDKEAAKQMRNGAKRSARSQSNGGLMRIAPLCIWCTKLPRDDLIKCVREETKLTHSNQTALDVSAAYVYTIQHLLTHPGDNLGAYEKCREVVKELKNEELANWFEDVEEDRLPRADDLIGWAKISFCHAIYYLKQKKDFEEAIKEMVSKAGDTDTNCCIVGGMLGALHGYEKLPKHLVKTLKEFKNDSGRQHRPEFLWPGLQVDKIIKDILKNLPDRADIIGGEE